MLTPEELERYKRQLTVQGFGIGSQEKLKDATVLIAGIGGLGGTAAVYLAAAGVGRLVLVHQGELTLSNLNRQILMTSDRVGKSRVVKAKETLKGINPNVDITVFDEPVILERLKKMLPDMDLVIDARHNFPERRVLNRASVETMTPMVEAAMNGMEGYIFNIIPGVTPCLNCLYPDSPEWDPFGFPVLGAVAGTIGCLAAIEGIKILTGFREPLLNRLLHFDMGSLEMRKYWIERKGDCPICGHIYSRNTRASARRREKDTAGYTCPLPQGATYPATIAAGSMIA